MQSAQDAIQRAEANDAREYEPVLLNQARNKVADAELLIEDREYREARRMLEKAAADARLAAARSDTAKTRNAAEELNQSIDALRQQIDGQQR